MSDPYDKVLPMTNTRIYFDHPMFTMLYNSCANEADNSYTNGARLFTYDLHCAWMDVVAVPVYNHPDRPADERDVFAYDILSAVVRPL